MRFKTRIIRLEKKLVPDEDYRNRQPWLTIKRLMDWSGIKENDLETIDIMEISDFIKRKNRIH